MSRFTGLQFTGLPCLPVFFFRATPSPWFTGGIPVYRGGSFFHARGAPPAAAHSHTRCCTQHNTTRWVLRAAANTCLHTICHVRQENYANLVTALPPQNSPAAAHAEVACTAFAVILMTTRKSTASANHALQQRSLPRRQQEKHRHAISKSVEIHLLFLCTCGRFPRYTGLPCLPVLFGLATTGR